MGLFGLLMFAVGDDVLDERHLAWEPLPDYAKLKLGLDEELLGLEDGGRRYQDFGFELYLCLVVEFVVVLLEQRFQCCCDTGQVLLGLGELLLVLVVEGGGTVVGIEPDPVVWLPNGVAGDRATARALADEDCELRLPHIL